MKSKVLKRIVIILMFIIAWTTLNFVFVNQELLFDDFSVNGETRIVLRIISNVDKEDIKQIVHLTTHKEARSIDIHAEAAGTKEANVRVAYLDNNERQAFITNLQQQYSNDLEIISIESIGGAISLSTRYKLFTALGIAALIIIALSMIYYKLMRSTQKG